ncbi:hypothetical protein [Egicoccus sp. AB-alg2]|uniref:hypothetical protein n=1 Tax=Egicoccus sp. AB-alg2 TaxID=3242693 RepID=UPI00359D8F40
MRARRTAVLAAAAGAMVLGSALPAAADHAHVRQLGNGQCVVLAEGSGEASVQLPHYEELPENRRHPLHVKVHLGEPGTRQGEHVVWVKGSADDLANCAGYVNR